MERHTLVMLVPNNCLIHNDVNNTLKFIFVANRHLQRNGVRTQFRFHVFDNREKVSTRTVHFVHESDTRHAITVRQTPVRFRLRLNAVNCRKQEHQTVQNAQRAVHLHRKVNVTRCVDDVHRVFFAFPEPFCFSRSRSDRDATLLLLRHVVHSRRAVMHLANAVRHTRIIENTLSSRRFTRVDVGCDTDVPRVF